MLVLVLRHQIVLAVPDQALELRLWCDRALLQRRLLSSMQALASADCCLAGKHDVEYRQSVISCCSSAQRQLRAAIQEDGGSLGKWRHCKRPVRCICDEGNYRRPSRPSGAPSDLTCSGTVTFEPRQLAMCGGPASAVPTKGLIQPSNAYPSPCCITFSPALPSPAVLGSTNKSSSSTHSTLSAVHTRTVTPQLSIIHPFQQHSAAWQLLVACVEEAVLTFSVCCCCWSATHGHASTHAGAIPKISALLWLIGLTAKQACSGGRQAGRVGGSQAGSREGGGCVLGQPLVTPRAWVAAPVPPA